MKIPLSKEIIDLEEFKSYILVGIPKLYGYKLDTKFIKRNMDSVTGLFVEDLMYARLQSRPTEIAISSKYFRFDEEGNLGPYISSYKHMIYLGIIHELLHSASRSYGYNGINDTTDTKRGLNEGITQMLAEDIYGVVVSPFSDAYKDFKKIAKILRHTIGTDEVLNSYFNHTDELQVKCDKMSYQGFYDELNEELTGLYFMKYDFAKNSLLKKVYNERIKIIYKKVIANVIIPKISSLKSVKDRKSYIRNILNSLYDDIEIYNYFKNYLSKYLNMSEVELLVEKKSICEDLIQSNNKSEYVGLMNYDKGALVKNIFVSREGIISVLIDGKLSFVDDECICEQIYYEMFTSRMSGFKTDELRYFVDQMRKGKSFSMYDVSSVNERRERICALKKLIRDDMGVVILNDYTCADNGIFKLDFIERKLDGVLEYDEIKKLTSIFKIEFDKSTNEEKVIYKDSLKEMTDPYIVTCVKAAYLFKGVASKLSKSTIIKKEDIERLYKELCSIMLIDIKCNGNLGLDEIKKYSVTEDRITSLYIEELFRYPINYEILYRYISASSCYVKEQTEKEEYYKSDKYMTVEADMMKLVHASKRT